MAQPQIVIEGVSHLYRPPSGRQVRALDEVSLEVGNREFVALLGPSGCGKSTLLYLIGGFLPTETGRILIDGGYRVGEVTPVDQFRYSAHVELVAPFTR